MSIATKSAFALFVLSCVFLPAAALQIDSETKLDVSVATERQVYEPGDVLTVYMNFSNDGNSTLFVKEAHVLIIAESWFSMVGHDEVRSITVPVVRGDRGSGYAKVKIPLYTPPGSYRIDSWIVYGTDFNESHTVMPYDPRTPVVSSRFEVQVGMVFVLAALILIWVFIRYVILSRIGGKPMGRNVFDDVARKELSRSLELVIIIVCFLALSTTLVWVGNTKRSADSFSAIYIKPGSYSGIVEKNMVSFTYGVMCFEQRETKYSLETYLNGELAGKEDFELCTGEKLLLNRIEDEERLKIPEDVKFPAKVSLILRTRERSYETFFWLTGRN
ncbi:MAG: hypothetical protein PHG85_02885 [Candidatus Altiarchaeota archaeon]|nr:hypothetical protein [Candidatus Altiarchaeota archaeon]